MKMIWQTVLDDRTPDVCKKMSGEVIEVNPRDVIPRHETGDPRDNCRCVLLPIIDENRTGVYCQPEDR